MKDAATKERFMSLRAQGLSFDKIAKRLKVSKQTLINWSKQFDLEISNLRAIELDALQEKYHLTKQSRLKLFGDRLNAITEELQSRNLRKMSTEKLFELQERYASVLKHEQVETAFVEEVDVGGPEEALACLKTKTRWTA